VSRSLFLGFSGLAALCLLPAAAHAQPGFSLEETRIEADITGPLAEVTVYQRFANPYTEHLEATYTFPLHEDAAVDGAAMRIGEREIRAQIHTRERAREIYEEARDSGQSTSLTEQERPNVFTQSVANIPPGEAIEVVLHMVQPLTYEDGVYSFEVPLVVGPRFVPDGVEDAAQVSPPVTRDSAASSHTVDIRVSAELGMALGEVWSQTHPEMNIVVDDSEAGAWISEIPADRDFVLNFDPANEEPAVAMLAQDGHFALLFEPQPAPAPEEVVPRELIFVVDNSCSMSGRPIETVKEVMTAALEGMSPRDSFHVIRFSEGASALSPEPLQATPENVALGMQYIRDLEGTGPTHMMAGVQAALGYPDDPDRQRVVAFMTDGYIGNEREIIAAIDDRLGSTRLFSFGIGSSVNRYLLDRMADVGRGAVTYVLDNDDRDGKVAEFYQRISKPVLTEISVDWGSMDVADVYPARLPDLYAGQSMLVTGRYTGQIDEILVKGRQGDGRYMESIALTEVDGSGIASAWARAKVRGLENQQLWGDIDEVEQEITDLALDYQLLTRYTSFVAVEREVTNPEGAPPLSLDEPLVLPEGVTFSDGVEGGLSRASMRPGDPLITADAPEDAQGVTAVFPWGEIVSLRWDPARQRWYHRFLVPREVEEGFKEITLLITHRDGHTESVSQTLHIDATAPEFEAEAALEGDETVVWLTVEEPLRSVHVFPAGRPDERVRVDLRQFDGDELEVRLPGHYDNIEIAVKDAALNLHRQRVPVER